MSDEWGLLTHAEDANGTIFDPLTETTFWEAPAIPEGHTRRWRRNGKTKTWKTRPTHFRIPVKFGLYAYGYVTHENASQYVVPKPVSVTEVITTWPVKEVGV